jgi:hypothetical protein
MGLRAFRLVGSLRGLVGVLLAGVAMGGTASVLPQAAVAAGGCPNEQLRAENRSTGLPDCRAYEMVTPAEKNSALVNPMKQPTVAADGSSLAGESPEGFAGLSDDELGYLGKGSQAIYRFERTGSGWATAALNPPHAELQSIGVRDSVWGPFVVGRGPGSVSRLQLRGADGSLSEVGPLWPGPEENEGGEQAFTVVGAAADALNGVVFSLGESDLLWPFDSSLRAPSLYEYRGAGNASPSLVGVSGGAGSTVLVSQCGTTLGGGQLEEYNAVSEDGSHVFFTATGADRVDCGGTEPPVNELFARIDGTETVAISEPSVVDCPSCDTSAPMDAAFRGASADGSKMFFTTTQPLLGVDTSENLYMYDFDPPAGQPKVVRVSGGDGSVSEPTAEVQGVTRISEDGSHVYFVAHGVLTTASNGEGERAQAGAENLYMFERDTGYPLGHTVFVAELCSGEEFSGSVSDTQCPGNGGTYNGSDEELWGLGEAAGDLGRPVQATPDGRFLLFASYADLTAGDTSTARQVFLYDEQTGSLVRVSAGLEGFNNDGNVSGAELNGDLDARIALQYYGAAPYDGASSRGGALARSMSDDGSYVFFQSPVGLTPQALNEVRLGQEYAQNVYEYHDGRVSLIGSDSAVSHLAESVTAVPVLIGTSASGENVFFRTGDQLVSQDTDTRVDFYDARVDGGFPEPAEPAVCQGDACQGALAGAPVFGTPSTASLAGSGNLAAPVSTPVVAPRGLTAAQKLTRALRECLKQPKRRRHSCQVQTRRRYGHTASASKSDRRGK